MTARVRIVPVQQFERWYAVQKARIKLADAAAALKRKALNRATAQ